MGGEWEGWMVGKVELINNMRQSSLKNHYLTKQIPEYICLYWVSYDRVLGVERPVR